MDSIPEKQCSKCKQFKPATVEYFFKDSRLKSFFIAKCKDCKAEESRSPERYQYQKEWRLKNSVRINENAKTRRDKDPEKYNEYQRDWRAKHPGLQAQYSKKCRDANIEEYRAKDREYYKNNSEKRKANSKRWRDNNPDKVILWYPKQKKYENSEHGKSVRKSITERRRARELNLPSLPFDQRILMDYWNGCCAICGNPRGMWHTIALDHWIAIKDARFDNPGTVPWNLVPMCHSLPNKPYGEPCCNNSKNSKDPIEWLVEKLGKRKAKQKLNEILDYFEWAKQNG